MMEIVQTSARLLWEAITDRGSIVVSHTIENFNAVITGFSSGGTEAFEALFPLAILVLQFYLLLATLKVLQMIWFLLREVRFVWRRPKSYSVRRAGGKRILIIGDSTAYGVGAQRPEDTIAGRLGRDFPNTEIINTAINGSRVKDAADQLRRAGQGTFDLIVISTGGNDIWHFTQLTSLERDLKSLLTEAIERSGHRVVLLFYANLGEAPIFPRMVRSILGRRTQKVQEVFSRAVAELQVPLIELSTDKEVHKFSPNPLLEEPEKYYARDRMHPNSEGYRLWYNHMWGEMVARNLTFKE